MSKHTSRASRWEKLSAKQYRSTFGQVRYHAGAWEGIVEYERLEAESGNWRSDDRWVGRFKRPRNAMIAVEDAARTLARQAAADTRVAFKE